MIVIHLWHFCDYFEAWKLQCRYK